jgi:hypothetical protein
MVLTSRLGDIVTTLNSHIQSTSQQTISCNIQDYFEISQPVINATLFGLDTLSPLSTTKDPLESYLEDEMLSVRVNPIEWWQKMGITIYSEQLAQMAFDYLSIPGM